MTLRQDLTNRPKLGISACLLGNAVRFDGGHKRERFLTDTLGQFIEWIPICPEVEVGMRVPREPVRLIASRAGTQMIAERSGKDWTDEMVKFALTRARNLATADLSGYIFKKNSPSCGIQRVRIYNSNGVPSREGRGLFATAVIDRFPLMPAEEEGRLNDPVLRENFIERVFAYHRWQALTKRKSVRTLIEFHTHHKFLLLAHSERYYRRLGRLVAAATGSLSNVTLSSPTCANAWRNNASLYGPQLAGWVTAIASAGPPSRPATRSTTHLTMIAARSSAW